MTPVFGRDGAVVAWLKDERVCSLRGKVIGWVRGDKVHELRGRNVNVYVNGAFRDRQGRVVAFVRGASAGVVLPTPHVPPVPLVPAVPPVPPVMHVPFVPSVPMLAWSDLSIEAYLELQA